MALKQLVRVSSRPELFLERANVGHVAMSARSCVVHKGRFEGQSGIFREDVPTDGLETRLG